MVNELLDGIAAIEQTGRPLVWLDAQDYGSQVVLNGKPFPWTNPTEFVAAYGQLQSLLKADVAPLDLGCFLKAWLDANPSALMEMSGKKRVRFALKRLLGMDSQRQLIREIAGALCDSLSQPVVLVLPPNGDLINWANNRANNVDPVELTEIDIDSVSVYLADYLRAFSGLEIAGVLVQLPQGVNVSLELLDLYSPIINVARHYHWALGVEVQDAVLSDPEGALQFTISTSDQSGVTGLVQGDAFWEGETVPCEPPNFVYARVPVDIEPERVLERLAALKRG